MRITIGTDQGVIILDSGHDSNAYVWKFVSHAHQNRKIQCVLAGHNESVLATGSHGAIYKTKDYRNWMESTAGLEGLNVTCVCAHPNNPLIMIAGTTPPALYRSDTAGLRWSPIDSFKDVPGASNWRFPEPPYRAAVRGIVLHKDFPDVILAAVSQGGFLGSLDGGATWMERSINIEREVNDLDLNPLLPTRIFASTSTGIYRSDDLGSTWTLLNHGLPYSYARCLVIAPENPNIIMACVSQARQKGSDQMLVFSENGGDTWTINTNGLPSLTDEVVTCLDASGTDCFTIGTSKGNVFFTNNRGGFWRQIHRGSAPVNAVLLQESSPESA